MKPKEKPNAVQAETESKDCKLTENELLQVSGGAEIGPITGDYTGNHADK